VIVIDSSVWIANLRNQSIPAVRKMREREVVDEAVVGDIVLTEVLQGARDEANAARLEADLRQFPIVTMVGGELATKAARHYRTLRSAGFTMNKIADLFIGTFCIEHDHWLLHCDDDFHPMERICGLHCLR
jgi:predicted nucleic acid-binding protein